MIASSAYSRRRAQHVAAKSVSQYTYRRLNGRRPVLVHAVDSKRDRLTPGYAQWPKKETEPQHWEKADLYTVTVKVRQLHSHPNAVRASIAAAAATVYLIPVAALCVSDAIDRRKKRKSAAA